VCRICPGLCFADNPTWIAIATILYCFEIREAKDMSGVEIEPIVDFDSCIRFVRKRSQCQL